MPQLDIFAFTSQLFWFYFVFILLFVLSIKKFLPSILAAANIRAHIQKYKIFQTKPSPVIDLRKQHIISVASISNFGSSLDKYTSENRKKKDLSFFISKRQKRHLNVFFDAKIAFSVFLIPSDVFVLWVSFFILVVGLYYYSLNSHIIEDRLIELKKNYLSINSSQITPITQKLSLLNSIFTLRNETSSVISLAVWQLYQPNQVANESKLLLKKFKSSTNIVGNSRNIKNLPDITNFSI